MASIADVARLAGVTHFVNRARRTTPRTANIVPRTLRLNAAIVERDSRGVPR